MRNISKKAEAFYQEKKRRAEEKHKNKKVVITGVTGGNELQKRAEFLRRLETGSILEKDLAEPLKKGYKDQIKDREVK